MKLHEAKQRTAEPLFDWVLQSMSALRVQRSGTQCGLDRPS